MLSKHYTCRSGLFQHITHNGIVSGSMLNKIVPIITLVSLCLLAVLLNLTAPSTVGPFGILAVFIFAYLSSLGVMTYFLYFMSRIIAHLSVVFAVRKPIAPLKFHRAYYYSTVLGAAPILLIGLQSVGQISFYEVVLIVVFVLIGCLYIAKRIR